MTKSVGVLIIHGMGTQEPSYADKLIAELKDRLGDSSRIVAWRPVYWADVLSERQEEYLDRAAATGLDLDWIKTRQFVTHALSDAASYRWIELDNFDNPVTTYGKIHQRLRMGLRALKREVGKNGKLVILAHSLGGHIVSNYIWDAQNPKPSKLSPAVDPDSYEGGGALRLLVTFGCNMPMFTFALDDVVPITLPPRSMKWRNYFDRDDVLGYPLRPINTAYRSICKDVEINVGPFLLSATPLSHNRYWTDNDFTKPVSRLIRRVISSP